MANTIIQFVVTAFEGEHIKGILKNPFRDETYSIDNWMQFLLMAEKIMDENNMPQATTQSRSFQKSDDENYDLEERTVDSIEQGGIPFQIRIASRQKNCWQGVICDKDKNAERFSGVVELTSILQKKLSQESF